MSRGARRAGAQNERQNIAAHGLCVLTSSRTCAVEFGCGALSGADLLLGAAAIAIITVVSDFERFCIDGFGQRSRSAIFVRAAHREDVETWLERHAVKKTAVAAHPHSTVVHRDNVSGFGAPS